MLKEVLRWHPVTPLGMSLIFMRPYHQLDTVVLPL